MELLLIPTTNASKKVTRKNCFVAEHITMSGDADHYETITIEGEDINLILSVIIQCAKFSHNINGGASPEKIRSFCENLLKELGTDWDAYDFLYDYFGKDVTYSDYYAQSDELKLFWYDENGIKCKAKFRINGKNYSSLSRYDIEEI